MPCWQQTSQKPSPSVLSPPSLRRSRIPRCTFFVVSGDFRQSKTLQECSKSSDRFCYHQLKFSNHANQYPVRQETTVTGKKSVTKLETEGRSARHEWKWQMTGDEVGETCDLGATTGRRGVPTEQSLRFRHPDYKTRLSSFIEIITDYPHQPSQAVNLEGMPPAVCSEASGSAQPFYCWILGNVFDWLSRLASFQGSTSKKVMKMPENQHRNLSELTLDNDTLEVQKNLSELKSCLSNNSSKAKTNLAESRPRLSTTCSKMNMNSSELEQHPLLRKAQSSEHKLTTAERRKNDGDPETSNLRQELKSSEGGQTCCFKAPIPPPDSSDLFDLIVSRAPLWMCERLLDMMQADAAYTISRSRSRLDQMLAGAAGTICRRQGPDFGLKKTQQKSETLLTKSLTSKFEEIADMSMSCHRDAQLQTLLLELPVENFYVLEWLVKSNIINESNASGFGDVFLVKPVILEILSRNHSLFPRFFPLFWDAV